MKKSFLLWIVAFFVTAVAAYYQRATGPTYPFAGTTVLSESEIKYSLPRSHSVNSDAFLEIKVTDSTVSGYVEWKRYKTADSWTKASLGYLNGNLSAKLPHQPPAGKLLYRLVLVQGNKVAVIPGDEPLIIRFRGDVPSAVLIAHIIAMFASMLLAARAGLGAFKDKDNSKTLTLWTLGSLFAGGLVLGPIVQHSAFGAWWTGWPFGTDLTDNKTAVAFLVWVGALVALRKMKNSKPWILTASILTFLIFLIPHSLLGSELDYNAQGDKPARIDSVTTR